MTQPLRSIILQAVPRETMRRPYCDDAEMCGDWFYDESGQLIVRVSADGFDHADAFLYAFHELVEAYLCRRDGISQQRVDTFDLHYAGDDEPGDSPNAPYRLQHRRAMILEHLLAHFLGISDYGEIK